MTTAALVLVSSARAAAPVAATLTASTDEDVPVLVPLGAADADGDTAFRYALVREPVRGVAKVIGSSLLYTPAADTSGIDTLGYTATDSTGATSAVATLTIDVRPVADAPVVGDLAADVAAGASARVRLTATDGDGDTAFRYTIASPPAQGTAAVVGASLVYTASASARGADTVTYVATDRSGLVSAPGTVTLTVTGANAVPTAVDGAATGPEDTPLAFTLVATDADGDALTYAIVEPPTHGVATLAGANGTFTPDADWNGADVLQFTASDGEGTSAPATVTLVVTPVADRPTATDSIATAHAGAATAIPLAVEDVDGDALTCIVRTAPAHGSVTVAGCVATYVADASYQGEDTFRWSASDGALVSRVATVTVTVQAGNTPPTASALSATTAEDTAVGIPLLGDDADGDPLTYVVVSAPDHGDLVVAGASATYTPDADYAGPDRFRYAAVDPSGATSAPALASLTVTAVPDAPTGAAEAVTTAEDTPLVLALAGDDADGDALTWALVRLPAHGTATLTGRSVLYTPPAEWSGVDSFAYVVTDATGLSSPLTPITVVVTAVDDPPTIAALSLTVDENASVSATLTATDPEGAPLAWSITSAPRHGAATLVGSRVSYTPTTGFSGGDSFGVAVTDGVNTVSATIPVTVVEANGRPTAEGGDATGVEDTPLPIPLAGEDPDGDPLTFSLVSAPRNGTVVLWGRTATYEPDGDWSGRDEFRFVVSDGYETSPPATVRVTIAAVDDGPTATPATVTTDEDTPVTFRLEATDPDGGSPPSFALARLPAHGRLLVTGSVATYTPDPDWSGEDELAFTAAADGHASVPASVALIVAAVDDPPVGAASTGHTPIGRAVDLTPVWTDVDSEGGSWVLDEGPRHGTVVLTSAGFRYTPAFGWYGADSFRWHPVTDGQAGEATGFRVNVHPPVELSRPDLPQLGLNKIQFGLGADPGDIYTADEPFWPESIFADFTDLGVQMYRQATRGDLVWSTVQIGEGNFNDGTSTEVLSNVDFVPSATLFEIQYASPTPPWWDASDAFAKEMTPEAYEYLDHVIDGYGDWVSSFEIGNEMYHWVAADPDIADPDVLPACYPDDGYSPAEQAVFVEEAARYLRAAKPESVITLASVNTEGEQSEAWLRDVLTAAGDDDWFDIVSYHSYDNWERAYNTRAALGELLVELGLDDRLIRLTETGSTSDADYTDRTNYPNSDESQCADVFRLALVGWGGGDASVIWHTYLPVTDAAGGEFQGFELVEFDGTWKPAAFSYQLLSENFVPFREITELTAPPDRFVYRIETTAGEVRWVAWGSGTWEVPAGMTEATSVYPAADGTFDWQPVLEGEGIALAATPVLLR